jgi:hypothetical protein
VTGAPAPMGKQAYGPRQRDGRSGRDPRASDATGALPLPRDSNAKASNPPLDKRPFFIETESDSSAGPGQPYSHPCRARHDECEPLSR